MTIRIVLSIAAVAFLQAGTPAHGADEDISALAAPLRQFDADGDGKLIGDELITARQAHRRGGKPPELNLDLRRYRNNWMGRHGAKFDIDGKPGLSSRESREAKRLWQKTVGLFTGARLALIKRYDRDDDGELDDDEIEASQAEGDRECYRIEKRVIREYLAARRQNEEAEKNKATQA